MRSLPLLLALSSLLPGCPTELTCQDLGCPLGQQCDEATGVCILPTRDCRSAPNVCRADETCDPNTGRCTGGSIQCGDGQVQCPRGQVCDASLGVCRAIGACSADEDCPFGERCDPLEGLCGPIPCAQPVDCDAGFLCIDATCSPGCAETKPCPTTQFCRIDGTGDTGVCLSECMINQDCNFGYICVAGDGLGELATCELEPPCQQDDDCRVDEACLEGDRCGQPPCTSDTECMGQAICDVSVGTCLGGTCPEDSLSPNHGPAFAAPQADGLLTRLSLCPGRPDWYAVSLQAGEVLTASLTRFERDLDLYLYDEQLRLLAVDELRAGAAQVIWRATRDMAPAYVEVRGARAVETTYDLELRRTTSGMSACEDDAEEENDTLLTASPLNLGIIDRTYRICPADEDWFRLVDLEATSTLEVSVMASQIMPQVTLFAPNGEQVEIDAAAGLELVRVGTPGDHHLRLRAPGGDAGSYRLRLSSPVLPELDRCADAGTHTTPEMALLLPEPGALENQTLCPADSGWELDWVRLAAPPQASLASIKIAPASGPGLLVALFVVRGAGEPSLIRTARGARGETLELVASVEAGDEVYARITSEEDVGRLETFPSYQVVYRYTGL